MFSVEIFTLSSSFIYSVLLLSLLLYRVIFDVSITIPYYSVEIKILLQVKSKLHLGVQINVRFKSICYYARTVLHSTGKNTANILYIPHSAFVMTHYNEVLLRDPWSRHIFVGLNWRISYYSLSIFKTNYCSNRYCILHI